MEGRGPLAGVGGCAAGVLRAVTHFLGEPPRKNANLEGRWMTISRDHSVSAGGPASPARKRNGDACTLHGSPGSESPPGLPWW
jgi:hypothetical protein